MLKGWVMVLYVEVIAVLAIAVVGVLLGKLSSSFRRPYWCIGYLISLSIVCVLILGRCYYRLNFIKPFDMLLAGRMRFILLTLAVTIGITTPMNRLKYRLEKILCCVIMGIVVGWFCVLPFYAPAVLKGRHESIKTRMSADGICFSNNRLYLRTSRGGNSAQ